MEGLRLMDPHWLAYPSGVGIIFGDFNICVIQKDDLMSGTSHSPMATQERLLCSILSFRVLEVAQSLITRGGTPQPLGSYALLQGFF